MWRRWLGMPAPVIDRANKVLAHLERSHAGDLGADTVQGDGPVPTAPQERHRGSGSGMSSSASSNSTTPRWNASGMRSPHRHRYAGHPVEALLKLNEIRRLSGVKDTRLHKA